MTKPKAAKSSNGWPSTSITIDAEGGQAKVAALAKTALRPTVQAGITATKLLGPEFPEPNLQELVNALSGYVTMAADGDLARPEAMLVTQAHTLDLLFNKLTRQAAANIGHYPDTVAIYLKLALRAQSQCRAVAETLHEMKHPRAVAFFQQANIANGPQQVNNGSPFPPEGSRAGENQTTPNRLIEDNTGNGNHLDCRATQSATPGDTQMATLGEIDRTKVPSGKTELKP